jgi:hypothetical protein
MTLLHAIAKPLWLAALTVKQVLCCYISPCFHMFKRALWWIEKEISGICPQNNTAFCRSTNGENIPLFLNSQRNCQGGQGTQCTKDEPCYPCDIQSIMVR